MTRNSEIKAQKVLKEFQRLLRSGKDYEVKYMYSEGGKAGFMNWNSAGNIIRKYYQKLITDEMSVFLDAIDDIPHDVKIDLFSKQFNVCSRESRLMIRYIKRNSILSKLHD